MKLQLAALTIPFAKLEPYRFHLKLDYVAAMNILKPLPLGIIVHL